MPSSRRDCAARASLSQCALHPRRDGLFAGPKSLPAARGAASEFARGAACRRTLSRSGFGHALRAAGRQAQQAARWRTAQHNGAEPPRSCRWATTCWRPSAARPGGQQHGKGSMRRTCCGSRARVNAASEVSGPHCNPARQQRRRARPPHARAPLPTLCAVVRQDCGAAWQRLHQHAKFTELQRGRRQAAPLPSADAAMRAFKER